MTDAQDNLLVLKDQAGDYFLLPQDALEQCRVPAERKAEIERLLNESDVSGHVLSAAYATYRLIQDVVDGSGGTVTWGQIIDRALNRT